MGSTSDVDLSPEKIGERMNEIRQRTMRPLLDHLPYVRDDIRWLLEQLSISQTEARYWRGLYESTREEAPEH